MLIEDVVLTWGRKIDSPTIGYIPKVRFCVKHSFFVLNNLFENFFYRATWFEFYFTLKAYYFCIYIFYPLYFGNRNTVVTIADKIKSPYFVECNGGKNYIFIIGLVNSRPSSFKMCFSWEKLAVEVHIASFTAYYKLNWDNFHAKIDFIIWF